MVHSRIKRFHTKEDTTTKTVLREVSRRSNCVDIVRKGCTVVSRRKERARRFYEVGCPKVKLEQEGEVSCGKVCEEGLPKVNLE